MPTCLSFFTYKNVQSSNKMAMLKYILIVDIIVLAFSLKGKLY